MPILMIGEDLRPYLAVIQSLEEWGHSDEPDLVVPHDYPRTPQRIVRNDEGVLKY